MHQTTVRFGTDLWSALEHEAGRLGVSVAHYVRDAALARLSFTQGREFAREHESWVHPAGYALLSERVQLQLDSAAAVRAQGRLARERARELRAQAEGIRLRTRVAAR